MTASTVQLPDAPAGRLFQVVGSAPYPDRGDRELTLAPVLPGGRLGPSFTYPASLVQAVGR